MFFLENSDNMNIFEEIMKEGVLVEPKAAERISKMSESEQAELIETLHAEKPLVLSEDFFESIIEVLELKTPKKLSVQESASEINSYINKLQTFFEKRNGAVSISNASGSVSVIGLVRNVLQDGFEIEDSTGTIKVLSKAQTEEDDVVMVTGKAINKTLYSDLVEFPDLKEKTFRKNMKNFEIVFGRAAEGSDYSISLGEKTEIAKNSLIVGKNPMQVKINNILILVLNNAKNIPPLQILKKRRLPGTFLPIIDVPDILLTTAGENVLENYKGVTLVAVNDKSFARINLKTGEVKFGSV